MRRSLVPPSRERDTVPVPLTREAFLEGEFRQFRSVASEFVRSLGSHVDFRTDPDGRAAFELNLRVVRSVFGKWSLEILVLLYTEHRLGFGDLRKALPKISSRVLSSKLKQLESHGLVLREVLATRPPRVNYRLSERGLTVTKLGEPVLLFLRVAEGLYLDLERTDLPLPVPDGLAVPSAAPGPNARSGEDRARGARLRGLPARR